MAEKNINILEIIQKIMTDPRFINIVSEILNDISNDIKTTTAPAPTKTEKTSVDYTTKSDATLRTMYAYRKKKGLTIEPELNTELDSRFPGYDAIQQKFTGRGGKRKVKGKKARVINWSEKTDQILRQAYKHRCNTPNGIDDELNVELALRFPDEYDQATRTFVKKPKTSNNSGTKHVQKTAKAAQRTTTVVQTEKPQVTTPTRLTVTLKLVKQSLDAIYNNVYVNGQLILRNHINTDVKLLGDGTLLAIHGIVTDNKRLPQRPLYMIYDTNLAATKWAGRDKFAGYDIYAKYITPTADGVNVMLSNKCTIVLNNEKLKRFAGLTRFEIER